MSIFFSTELVRNTQNFEATNFQFDDFAFQVFKKSFKFLKSGSFVKFRTYMYGREYKQKGLCLYARSRYNIKSTICVRSRPFSCELRFSAHNPNLKIYVVDGDGIRTHGYSRNINLAS